MFVYPIVTCTILLTTLLIFVLTKRHKSGFRSFVYLCACTLWWHGSWAYLFVVEDQQLAEKVAIFGHIGILYLPVAYRSLYSDLVGSGKQSHTLKWIYGILVSLLLFTHTIIDGVNRFSWGYYPNAGFLHPVFIVLVSYVVVESMIKCVILVRNNRDQGKKSSLLIGMFACFIFSAGSVDFLLNYKITILAYPIGFVATILFVVMNAIGITKYELYQRDFLVADLEQRNFGLRDDLELKSSRLLESEKLLAKISRQNEDLKIRDRIISAFLPLGVRRELSAGMNPLDYKPKKLRQAVIFVDVRDYTAIAEQGEIEDVYILINKYFDLVNQFVYRHGGEVNKYLGDGAMGLFSSPKECVSAVVNFLRALEEFNIGNRAASRPEIRIGIGISFGEVLSANFGSESKVERSVIGDVVNIASRLEHLTKDYGCQVIADNEFIRQLDDYAFARPIGIETLKGKSKPIKIFEIFEHCSQREMEQKIGSKFILEGVVDQLTTGAWAEAMMRLESIDRNIRSWDKPLQALHRMIANSLRRGDRDKETA